MFSFGNEQAKQKNKELDILLNTGYFILHFDKEPKIQVLINFFTIKH